MAAKLKKSDLQQIIDLRKQRITSPADIARMGFRPRRPFRHSLAQELIRSFEKLGVDTKKLESAAQRDQRERRRLYEKQMARAKKNLAGIKNPFRYRIEERRKAFEKVSVSLRLDQRSSSLARLTAGAQVRHHASGAKDFGSP